METSTMKNTLIYWPVLVQLLIPFWVLILNGKRKSVDRRSGAHDPKESAINNTAWSLPVVLTSNSLANQFQLPIVFYVLCLILASISSVSVFALAVAWLFVATRWFHAYVHVTSNHIPSRFGSFVVSTLVLLVLLVTTGVALYQIS
ncbi:MAG TPA: hypothetical protein DCW52_13030 [Gammaproteobacteria bacterium]|nr:hypothetical protein [Gammaproteobacteria bacterium]